MESRGFTLTELLVVIFISGVLAVMLGPVLSGAGEDSGKVACVGNLRQLGEIFILYTKDFDGYFSPNSYTSPSRNWHQVLNMAGFTDVYLGYSEDRGMLFCPAQAEFAPAGSRRHNVSYGTMYYGVLRHIGTVHPVEGVFMHNRPPLRVADVPDPAHTILAGEQALVDNPAVGSSTIKNVSRFTTFFPGRHAGKDHILFADGGVRSRADSDDLNEWIKMRVSQRPIGGELDWGW